MFFYCSWLVSWCCLKLFFHLNFHWHTSSCSTTWKRVVNVNCIKMIVHERLVLFLYFFLEKVGKVMVIRRRCTHWDREKERKWDEQIKETWTHFTICVYKNQFECFSNAKKKKNTVLTISITVQILFLPGCKTLGSRKFPLNKKYKYAHKWEFFFFRNILIPRS